MNEFFYFCNAWPLETCSDYTVEDGSHIPYFYAEEWHGYNAKYDYERSKLLSLYLASLQHSQGMSVPKLTLEEDYYENDSFGVLGNTLDGLSKPFLNGTKFFFWDYYEYEYLKESHFKDDAEFSSDVEKIAGELSVDIEPIDYIPLYPPESCDCAFGLWLPIDCASDILMNELSDIAFCCFPSFVSIDTFVFPASYAGKKGAFCFFTIINDLDSYRIVELDLEPRCFDTAYMLGFLSYLIKKYSDKEVVKCSGVC